MKILLATSSFIPNGGGIASYAQELIKAYGKTNDISILVDEKLTESDITNVCYSTYGEKWRTSKYCKKIIDLIDNQEFELIINSNSKIISVISPFIKVPIISVSHFANGILAAVAGYNSNYVNRIISLSIYGKEYIEKKFIIKNSEKISVIYNYVDDIPAINDKTKISNKKLIIVYPGGVSLHKSPDVVIKTLMMLIKTKYDFEFYWLGDNQTPISRISIVKDIKQFCKTDKRIFFTGKIKREDAKKIIDTANIFLLPSRGEGCPISLLEAMRTGCIPIVSNAKHASRELIEDGKFGFMVKQDSPKDLFNKIEYILTNHNDCNEFYNNTFQYMVDKLSKKRWKEQMDIVISNIIGNQKKYLPFTKLNFYKSLYIFNYICFIENMKMKIRSIRYFSKFNWMYITK